MKNNNGNAIVMGGVGFTTKIRTCLVTGGAGFIGSHLTKRLLGMGYCVTVIDDFSEGKRENLPAKNPKLKIVKASILDNVSSYFEGVDVIYHLAALPRLKRSLDDPEGTHKVNVDGTFKMLMEAKKHSVKKFIFASTSSIYGNKNKIPFREDMIPDPLVPYSLHKLIGEQYCKIFSDLWNIQTVCLRYFNVYGSRMNPDGSYANLLPKFIKIMSNGQKPTINGTGRHSRDFTYIDDVVNATILAAGSSVNGEVINIGFGKTTSVNQVVKILNKVLGKNIKPNHGPGVTEPRISLAFNLKAKKLLGWVPKVEIEEGIRRMVHGS